MYKRFPSILSWFGDHNFCVKSQSTLRNNITMEQHCVECGKIRFMQGGREVQSQAPLASSEAFSFCLANSASLQHCCRTLTAFSSHLQRLQCICLHVSMGEVWPQHVWFSSSLNKNGKTLNYVKPYHLKNSIFRLQTGFLHLSVPG